MTNKERNALAYKLIGALCVYLTVGWTFQGVRSLSQPQPVPTPVVAPAPTPVVAPEPEVVEKPGRVITVDTPLEVGTCGGQRCGPNEAQQQSEDYWTQQLMRDAQSRAECRAGKYDRNYCNRWFPDWETRFD